MLTFQNSKFFNTKNLRELDKSVSTLLIPAHLLNALNHKQKKHGNNISVYLKKLLRTFRIFTHSGMLPPPTKIKTEFQKEGLDLKRISFRPDNSDWIELGELALAFGKSRCWVFTFLLELDLSGMSEALSKSRLVIAVPTSIKLILQAFWSLEKSRDSYFRSYNVRV